MKTALIVVGVAGGAFVLWRIYQAVRFNVTVGRALQNPLVPISALQEPGRAPGMGTLLEISKFPQARTGRAHF